MQSHKNNIIIASAGGRKTTFVTDEALKQKNKKVLITTYTRENLDQINSYLVELNGCIPTNITVLSWYTFLLGDGVRPYQNHLLQEKRVQSIDFESKPSRYIGKDNEAYFVNRANNIYQDRVSDFICQCNRISKGLIIKRLENVFDHIYIDEMQDLSGWDQDLVELLLDSKLAITLVGDPRQATYSTNNSQKNKAQKGKNITAWIEELSKKDKCSVEERTECFRCNQEICDFADGLYPKLSKTISKNTEKTRHDGIFTIKLKDVLDYKAKHNPKILRWSKSTNTLNLSAINIGISKGRTYDRVLIFPTNPMKQYLKTKDLNKAGDISKLYVAVTRARYSVTFVLD